MDLKRSLFDGKLVCLAPIDPDKDSEIESKWTHDSEYLTLVDLQPARPLSPAQVKKGYEKIEKHVEEDKNLFYFTLRTMPEERLVGFARIYHVSWSHATGMLQLGIGDPGDRRRGFGSEGPELLLRYAFTELNLNRVTLTVFEYNPRAIRFYEKAGFVLEGRERKSLLRGGNRWDVIFMGVLREEWLRQNPV